MEAQEFLRIQARLAELKEEEDHKLIALSQLQKAFVGANSDAERDYVKQTVGQIREMSRSARQEIRELRQRLANNMTIEKADELYARWLMAGKQQ